MKVLLTNACKPIPMLLDKYLSVDDVSYRFIVDQDVFSATADIPSFPLHFLAQNINVPSVVWQWPTFEMLESELKKDHYDYIGINFKLIDLYTVEQMIKCIREASPESRIILGGYGTIGFDEPAFAHIGESADYVCTGGDGIEYMRNLLSDFQQRAVICELPPETIAIPHLPPVRAYMPYLLSSLGCGWKCEFCCTAAYTEGRVIDVMTPEEIHESMKWYYRQYRGISEIRIMDEELLLRMDRVRSIGELIRKDDEFGLSTMGYLAFGTVKALGLWDPEELLLNGVCLVWVGIESMYSYQRKKGEVDQRALMRSLHDVGISTQLSWIVGDDSQTKENINADVEDLLAHAPCTLQLTRLNAFPGTPLYRRLKAAGRTAPPDPSQYSFLGNSMRSLHFTYEETIDLIFKIYRRMYETNGPSIMGALEVCMNGYEHCARSRNSYLKAQRRAYYRKKIQDYSTLMDTAVEFAPTASAKQKMVALRDRYADLFGPLSKRQESVSDQFLRLTEKEMARRAREGWSPPKDAPSRRYVYPGREERRVVAATSGRL